MNPLKLFIPLAKVDETQRLVFGVLASETLDKSGEIFDYSRSKPHFEKWSQTFEEVTKGKSKGNLRRMHGNHVSGHLTAIAFNDEAKQIEIAAKVTDDEDWRKVQEGDYTGFSIGGRYAEQWKDEAAKAMRYEAIPAEASLVDNPAIPNATFAAIKADGTTEIRKFHAPERVTFTPALLKAEIEAGRADALCKILNAEAAKTIVQESPIPSKLPHEEPATPLADAAAQKKPDAAKVAAREDASPKEGESKYGDVAFADPTNKKYPIDTAAHIRAAWNYINKPANAGKYSAKDAASIKRRIISAWKKKIDAEGPPSAEKAVTDELRKCWQLRQAIDARMSLDSLLYSEAGEAATKDEDAAQVSALQEAIAALDRFILSEAQEELGDTASDDGGMEMSMNPEELKKAFADATSSLGAQFTKSMEDTLQKALAPVTDKLAKVEESVKGVEKTQTELGTSLKAVDERLKTVEATPAAVGRPAAPAEKTLGAPSSAAAPVALADLKKAVDDIAPELEAKGMTHQVQTLRLSLAAASMRGAQ